MAHRVQDALREAGILDTEQAREARLVEIQAESLGTKRRNRITTDEYRSDRINQLHWEDLEKYRLSNISGTQEHVESRNNEEKISSWNNAWTALKDDGAVEEDLGDINRGQTHRAKLMNLHLSQAPGGENIHSSHPRGALRGRGGGVIGSRARAGPASRIPRIPTGIPVVHDTAVSEPPNASMESTRRAREATRAGARNYRETGRQKHEQGSASNVAPVQKVARPLNTENWESRLATPETFMAAVKSGPRVPPTPSIQASTPLITPSAPVVPATTVSEESESPEPAKAFEAVADLVTPTRLSAEADPTISEARNPPVQKTDLLIDFAGQNEPTYSGELLGLQMPSGSGRAARTFTSGSDNAREKPKQTEPGRSGTPKAKAHEKPEAPEPTVSGMSMAETTERVEMAGGKARDKEANSSESSSSSTTVEYANHPLMAASMTPKTIAGLPAILTTVANMLRERIVSKHSIPEDVYFGAQKRTGSNAIFGRHLMPGYIKGSRDVGGNSVASSAGLSLPMSFSTTAPLGGALAGNVELPPALQMQLPSQANEESSEVDDTKTATGSDKFSTENPFGSPVTQSHHASQSGGIIGSSIHRAAFSRSAPSTDAAPLASPMRRPREATNIFGAISRQTAMPVEDEDPFTRVTSQIYMPSGTSRLQSLTGLQERRVQPEASQVEEDPFARVTSHTYMPSGTSRLQSLTGLQERRAQPEASRVEENPFASVTSNVEMPSGPSRFSSLQSFGSDNLRFQQQANHPTPRRGTNNRGRRR